LIGAEQINETDGVKVVMRVIKRGEMLKLKNREAFDLTWLL
jgi:hypothetical protein